MDIATVFWN